MIKGIIGWVGTWGLFYLGHWIHFPMVWFKWAWIYPIYNLLMLASSSVQDWANIKGPWSSELD